MITKVSNVNKLRAANDNESLITFDYTAEVTRDVQTPVVKVIKGSFKKCDEDWIFKAINLRRLSESDKGIRTYKLSRILGLVKKL